MANEDIMKFFSEMGYLRRVKHSGLMMTGVSDPDSVAEHSFRTAIIGSVLAEMEGVDPDKVALICLTHDITETRIGDHHKVNARYINTDEAEGIAFEDQLAELPETLAKRWRGFRQEYNERNTKEGIVAKDADWLEMALTAKEYLEIGYQGAQNWIDNVEKALETDSAKAILKLVKESDFTNSWWQGLKKMTYEKLEEKED